MRHDGVPPENRAYRDHDDSFGIGYRATAQGHLVTDQSESTGLTTRSCHGDETGWAYWEADTRAMGAWAQKWLAVVDSGYVYPVRNQSLDADTRFAGKELVTSAASDDPTKVRHLTGTWSNGDYGFVVSASEDDSWELIFFPMVTA